MNSSLDERDVRQQLQASLDSLPVGVADFGSVRVAGARRRRQRQVATGLVSAAGAAILVVVLALSLSGGHRASSLGETHSSGKPPTAAELRQQESAALGYIATEAGADHRAGPFTDSAGTWGFYDVTAPGAVTVNKSTVTVLQWVNAAWKPVATVHTSRDINEVGGPVLGLRRGPAGAGDGVSLFAQLDGGDNVPAGVIVRLGGVWQWASFGPCPDGVCGTAQTSPEIRNGRMVGNVLHSYPDNCTPACYDGTQYDEIWQWSASAGKFLSVSMKPLTGSEKMPGPQG